MEEFQDMISDGIEDTQMDDLNNTDNDSFDDPQEMQFDQDVEEFLNSGSIIGSSVI